MARSREPIGNTCPDIDKMQRAIKNVSPYNIAYIEDEDLRDLCENLYECLNDCSNFLEDMRSSNSTLRNWGNEEAARVDELEQENDELNSKLDDLTYQLECAHEKINQLENEIEEKASANFG